jgi:hypothetical protein
MTPKLLRNYKAVCQKKTLNVIQVLHKNKLLLFIILAQLSLLISITDAILLMVPYLIACILNENT